MHSIGQTTTEAAASVASNVVTTLHAATTDANSIGIIRGLKNKIIE